MNRFTFGLLVWLVSVVVLFGCVHLGAAIVGAAPDDVAGWFAMGSVCALIAWGGRKP